MKKGMASLEIKFIVQELSKQLKNAKLSRIYGSGKQIALVFHKAGIGKSVLNLIVPNFLYISEQKLSLETTGFGLKLRKHLENSILREIRQIKSERIVEFVFEKESIYRLFAELFSKGNIILCDKEGKIIATAEQQEWSTRTIKPGFEYKLPELRVNLYELDNNEFEMALNETNKDSFVKFLAMDLGLSGVYAEETCLRADIDKNKKPIDITKKEKIDALKTIKSIINSKPRPVAVFKNSEMVDATPFELEIYSGFEKKYFDSYSAAIEFSAPKEEVSETEKRINEIKRIISEQEAKMAELEKGIEENKRKGELIYENYMKVKNVLSKKGYGKVAVEL